MSSKKNTISWEEALSLPIKDWSSAGSIHSIYPPLMDLIKRLQAAYHKVHGKRPNLPQTFTYALCLGSYAISRKCSELESLAANREATKESTKKDPNLSILKSSK